MAYANTDETVQSSKLAQKFLGLIAALRLSMTRRAVYRDTMRELSALTDRELMDMGLHRGDLHSIALDAAYGQ
jgi:uncharacterized protein YjiS (DUF1127 family)